jgi:hypothetical protein
MSSPTQEKLECDIAILFDTLFETEQELLKRNPKWERTDGGEIDTGHGNVTFDGVAVASCATLDIMTHELVDSILELKKRLCRLDRMYRFKKKQIMAYVAYHNGPLTREQLLHQASIFEFKEYHPTSNNGYFPGVERDGSLMKCGKPKYGKALYTAGSVGLKYVNKITSKVGTKPAERAKLISKSYDESKS